MEKAMATNSSTVAWKIPWAEEPGGLQSPWGRGESGHDLSDFTFTFHFHALEREMAAHSCSCLENPRPSGAWWTAVHGVAQSPIRLKRLSSSSNLILSWRSIWDSDCVTTLYLGRPVGDTGTVKFLYVLKVLRQWLDLRSWY